MARWVGVAAGIGLLIMIGLPGYIAIQRSEPDGVDDADLSVIPVEVSAEDNGLTHLLAAIDAVAWSPEAEAISLGIRKGDALPEDRARVVVDENRAAFDKLDDALRAPHFLLPEAAPGESEISTQNVLGLQNLIHLLEMRALLDANAGQWAEAFRDAHAVLRVASRLEGATGANLLATTLSVTFRDRALKTLRRVAHRAPLSAKQAREWSQAISPYRSSTAAWKRMWSAEYQNWKRLLLWISNGEDFKQARLAPAHGVQIANASADAFVGILRLEANRTLAQVAEMTRAYQRASEKSCSELDDFALSEIPLLEDPASGETLATPNYLDFFLRRCAADSSLSATQTLIALRAYQLETQALPDDLAALVPHYLDSIPLDAFDGAPIRYSRSNRVVYSIGIDGRDSEGVAPSSGPFLEPAYPIEFSSQPPGV
jgi:hypothetical protein